MFKHLAVVVAFTAPMSLAHAGPIRGPCPGMTIGSCPTWGPVGSLFFTPVSPDEPQSHHVAPYIACTSQLACERVARECSTSNGVPCQPLPWRIGWPDPSRIMRIEH